MSKEASSNKAEDIMDVSPEAVQLELQSHGVQRLIHGHTHRPATTPGGGGRRWVLGDWDASGWSIEARPDHIELYSFNIIQ